MKRAQLVCLTAVLGVASPGAGANAGRFVEADLEELAIIAGVGGQTLLLVSSQGDSSVHFYVVNRNHDAAPRYVLRRRRRATAGVHYAPVPLGPQFPLGLLVVQNGRSPPRNWLTQVSRGIRHRSDNSTQIHSGRQAIALIGRPYRAGSSARGT